MTGEQLHPIQYRELEQLLSAERFPHAILFHGPAGNGKLALALALARLLMNQDPNGSDRIGALNHPDVHWMYPTPGSDKKDAALQYIADWQTFLNDNFTGTIEHWMEQLNAPTKSPNIPAHACQHILRTMQMKAYEGAQKVQCIWMTEYLGQDANRLLKLIEEPPEDSYLIMITEDLDSILATIKSRCFIMYIPAIDQDILSQLLEQDFGLTAKNAKIMAHLAEGNVKEARQLVKQNGNEIAEMWVDWLRYGFKWRPAEYIRWVSDFGRRAKVEQRLFWKYGLQFTRQVLLKKLYMDDAPVWDTFAHVVDVMEGRLSLGELRALQKLCESRLASLKRNAHVNILMTDAGIRLRDIIHHKVEDQWDVNLVESV